jgi:ABC-type sugar transport system substrate-binding protein
MRIMKLLRGPQRQLCFIASLFVLFAMLVSGCSAEDETDTGNVGGGAKELTIGFYADAAEPYYQQVYEVLKRASFEDSDCNWQVDFQVGEHTAESQLKAIDDFIVAGYDAVVAVQYDPETTAVCIEKCKQANIPYFGAVYEFGTIPNALDASGCVSYDFVMSGYHAGLDALNRGVGRIIMMEGDLRPGIAVAQTMGFLKAYADAGKSLGGFAPDEIAGSRPSISQLDGTQDIEIAFWASGGWAAKPAQDAMRGAISALGADSFDGVYVHNDPMAEGVIAAMQDEKLPLESYWIGAGNGKEVSWDWAEDGKITMDVNQPAALEGILLYQQLKSHFAGEAYRKYVRPYLTPYTKENIFQLRPGLVPATDIDAFMQGHKDGAFVTDINDPKFIDIPAFAALALLLEDDAAAQE